MKQIYEDLSDDTDFDIIDLADVPDRDLSLIHIQMCIRDSPLTFQHRAGVSPYTSPYGFAQTCVFAKQLLGPILCGQLSLALLLPKLRSHFAEFLNNASPVGLRILSSPTCVGLRYGYSTNNSGFSWQLAHTFPYFSSVCITSSDYRADLPTLLLPRLPRDSIPASALPLRPHSSVILQYRNFNLLSIGYVFRPHLRPRLTQSRSALLWKPWVFGRKDSHLPLATHSGILSS